MSAPCFNFPDNVEFKFSSLKQFTYVNKCSKCEIFVLY